MTSPLLYTTAEAAALLAVKPSWLKRRTKVLPCTRLGERGLIRWSEQNLVDIIAGGRSEPVRLDADLRPVRGAA
jgi:hypothetical protein